MSKNLSYIKLSEKIKKFSNTVLSETPTITDVKKKRCVLEDLIGTKNIKFDRTFFITKEGLDILEEAHEKSTNDKQIVKPIKTVVKKEKISVTKPQNDDPGCFATLLGSVGTVFGGPFELIKGPKFRLRTNYLVFKIGTTNKLSRRLASEKITIGFKVKDLFEQEKINRSILKQHFVICESSDRELGDIFVFPTQEKMDLMFEKLQHGPMVSVARQDLERMLKICSDLTSVEAITMKNKLELMLQ